MGNRTVTLLLITGLLTGSSLATTACATDSVPEVPAGPDGTVDPVLVAGRQVYTDRCANCHGNRGQGGRGPKATGPAMVEIYPVVADQVEVVTEGRSGMPGFADALTPAEVEAVVRFTREVL